MFRIGFGYDVHQLVENRPLILGGITIDYPKGLLGHSDADVLTHTIMDAILGALNLGSIGDLFPDTDPTYKDSNSLDLLDEVVRRMTALNYTIGNIDCVIAAQKPKLSPHIPAMKECLSKHLNTDVHNVSVKATTTEKLGFVGEEKGMSAYATVLLKES